MSFLDLIDRYNKLSYGGNLRVVSKVKSVNCKEWEAEKEYFKKELKLKNSSSATRYYVAIKNTDRKKSNEHCHEGHLDFRPVSESISDAFLPLPNHQEKDFFVTCKRSYKSDDPFNPTIVTVPYITPDQHISLCSPASMWIVLTILSQEFGKDYYSLADINKSLPSQSIGKAVSLREYTELFRKINLFPHYYLGKRKKEFYDKCETQLSTCTTCTSKISQDDDCLLSHFYDVFRQDLEGDFKDPLMDSDTLYAYIESEIPVYLVFKHSTYRERLKLQENSNEEYQYHAVVAIGHTLDKRGNYSDFIIHDVNYIPFLKVPKEIFDEELMEAIVLLPEDIYTYETVKQTLENIIIPNYNEKLDNIFKENSKLIFRPFLMRSQKVKFWYTNKNLYPLEVRNMYSKADFPKYVWVFEIGTLELKEKNKCIGQIILNATASRKEKDMGLVLINFPKFRRWYQNKRLKRVEIETPAFDSLSLFRYPPTT